jgi:hypothetical protein
MRAEAVRSISLPIPSAAGSGTLAPIHASALTCITVLPACRQVPLGQRQNLPTAFLGQCAVRCQQARLVIVHHFDG